MLTHSLCFPSSAMQNLETNGCVKYSGSSLCWGNNQQKGEVSLALVWDNGPDALEFPTVTGLSVQRREPSLRKNTVFVLLEPGQLQHLVSLVVCESGWRLQPTQGVWFWALCSVFLWNVSVTALISCELNLLLLHIFSASPWFFLCQSFLQVVKSLRLCSNLWICMLVWILKQECRCTFYYGGIFTKPGISTGLQHLHWLFSWAIKRSFPKIA